MKVKTLIWIILIMIFLTLNFLSFKTEFNLLIKITAIINTIVIGVFLIVGITFGALWIGDLMEEHGDKKIF